MAIPTLAQDDAPAPPPVVSPAQVIPASRMDNGSSVTAGEGSLPATAPASPSSGPAPSDMGSSPQTSGQTASQPVSVNPTTPSESEPAPSLLGDPAGAISRMLEPAKRDPNLPHDLSPWGMFKAADWVVKSVMLGLAFASLATWTVWLAKTIEIACARARAKRALAAVIAAPAMKDAAKAVENRGGPAAFMVRAAEDELRQSETAIDLAGGDGVKERVALALSRIEAQAGRRLTKSTGVLATIGSTAPFVGLFGTVWGIMNAFIGISQAQTTNLAVVAPGIAEALLATAIGLVAAIPAVIIYNVFARSITSYRQLLADNAGAVERLVSRDLDFRKAQATE